MIKFFYDHFTEEDIAGMFTPTHYITIVVFFVLLFILLYLSRNLDEERIKKIHLGVAIFVTGIEIIKDVIQVIKGNEPSSWLPLFFCSLFIYASWFPFSKNGFIKNMGYAYICLGGVMSGIFFTFYPSTSLVWYPIWHPLAIYGFVYHFAMTYLGLLLIIRNVYLPEKKHALNYFVFISVACLLASIINPIFDSNCMFLRDPMNLPLFSSLAEFSPLLWALFAYIGQSIPMFWLGFGLFQLYRKIKEKKAVC